MRKLIENVYDEEEQIDILKRIIRIPSENPGGLEEDVALEIKRILKEEGIKSTLKYVDQGRPNLYTVLEGEVEGKTLLYNGHLDTVPVGEGWTYNPFGAHEDDSGLIYGRGTADMKSGVAAMLYAAICLKRLGYPKKGKLILFLNVDEEMSNLGMKQFLNENIDIDYAIISEPSNMDVNIGHRGTARYEISTKGTSGHVAYIDNPKNAIEKMNIILIELFKYSRKIVKEKKHIFLGPATSNVTMIEGGIIPNMIPDKCTIVIDRRIIPGETEESIIEDYQSLLFEADSELEYELKTISFIPPSIIDINHELVQTVFNIANKKNNNIKIKDFEATCEAPYFSVYKNIPTIIYGPGSLEHAHIIDERVSSHQVIEAGKNFIAICIELLK